jgi:hypothetical protein
MECLLEIVRATLWGRCESLLTHQDVPQFIQQSIFVLRLSFGTQPFLFTILHRATTALLSVSYDIESVSIASYFICLDRFLLYLREFSRAVATLSHRHRLLESLPQMSWELWTIHRDSASPEIGIVEALSTVPDSVDPRLAPNIDSVWSNDFVVVGTTAL